MAYPWPFRSLLQCPLFRQMSLGVLSHERVFLPRPSLYTPQLFLTLLHRPSLFLHLFMPTFLCFGPQLLSAVDTTVTSASGTVPGTPQALRNSPWGSACSVRSSQSFAARSKTSLPTHILHSDPRFSHPQCGSPKITQLINGDGCPPRDTEE